MIKAWVIKLKNAFKRIIYFYLYSAEDELYNLIDANCWMLFPPSFYKTHSEEEIRKAEEKAKERIQKLIDDLEDNEDHKKRES